MNTTNLFVELLVIGLGPLLAIVLLGLAVLQPEGISIVAVSSGASLALILPALGLTYVFGIIADRLADRMMGGRISRRLRHQHFASDDEYHRARRTIIFHADAIYRIRQYGRSRMRICRGWAFNTLLLAVPANLWAATNLPLPGLVLLNVFLVALFLGSLYSWHALASSEYRKIKGGADFVRAELDRGPPPADLPE